MTSDFKSPSPNDWSSLALINSARRFSLQFLQLKSLRTLLESCLRLHKINQHLPTAAQIAAVRSQNCRGLYKLMSSASYWLGQIIVIPTKGNLGRSGMTAPPQIHGKTEFKDKIEYTNSEIHDFFPNAHFLQTFWSTFTFSRSQRTMGKILINLEVYGLAILRCMRKYMFLRSWAFWQY